MWNCSPGSTCEKLSTYSTHVRVFFFPDFIIYNLSNGCLHSNWTLRGFSVFLENSFPTIVPPKRAEMRWKVPCLLCSYQGAFIQLYFVVYFLTQFSFSFFFLHHISTAIKKSVSNLHLSLNWQHFSHPNNYNYCLLFRKALDILYIWKDFIFLKRLWWNNLLKDISSCRKTSEIIFMIDSRLD